MKLVDTTVAVDHLRGDERATALLERLVGEGEVLLASELTRFELLAGMLPEEAAATEELFSVFSWVPVNEEIARAAGDFAASHRKAYSGIDTVDYVLAATASVLGAELLTTNVRHFPMLPGVRAPYSG
jgi:hypothetical protein